MHPCNRGRAVLAQSHSHATSMLPSHNLQLPLAQQPLIHLLTLGEPSQPPSQAQGRQERPTSLPPLGTEPKTLPEYEQPLELLPTLQQTASWTNCKSAVRFLSADHPPLHVSHPHTNTDRDLGHRNLAGTLVCAELCF